MTLTRTLLAGAIALLLTTTVQADVTLEERVSVTGAGLMKMANMSGTTRTIIAADRARTESNLQFESGMMRTLARGAGQSTEIVRLDQDKVYTLDPSEKTYTETTLAELRAQLDKAMDQAGQAQATQIGTASGVDDSQCEWSDPKADVQRTGEKASIAGSSGRARDGYGDASLQRQGDGAGVRLRPRARSVADAELRSS